MASTSSSSINSSVDIDNDSKSTFNRNEPIFSENNQSNIDEYKTNGNHKHSSSPLLSIIITSSPIKAHPDLSMITRVIHSLKNIIQDLNCPLIMTFDGYKTIDTNKKELVKTCRIHSDLAHRYNIYKQNCKDMILDFYKFLLSFPGNSTNINQESHDDNNNNNNGNINLTPIQYEELARQSNTNPPVFVKHTIFSNNSDNQNLNTTTSPTTSSVNLSSHFQSTSKHYQGNNLIRFMEFSDRFGFALSVREALLYVDTPFVMVVQHDWELLCPEFNIVKLLETMSSHSDIIKYIGLPSSSSIRYSERQWQVRDLPPAHCLGHLAEKCEHCFELNSYSNINTHDDEKNYNVDHIENDKNKASGETINPKSCPTEKPKKQSKNTIKTWKVDPLCSKFHPLAMEPANSHKGPARPSFVFNDLEFVRLYFWHDKPHIACTSYYKNQVFGQGFFKRGDFIEDVFGHMILNEIRQEYLNDMEQSEWANIDMNHENGDNVISENDGQAIDPHLPRGLSKSTDEVQVKSDSQNKSEIVSTDENDQEQDDIPEHLLYQKSLNKHLEYGAWLYYPSNGLKKYILHLHGRYYVTEEMKEAKKVNSLMKKPVRSFQGDDGHDISDDDNDYLNILDVQINNLVHDSIDR